MSKVRVVYKADKSISVIHPCPNSKRVGETEEDWLIRVFDRATPEGAEYDDIDISELPASREFRNAWECEKGKSVTINKTKKTALTQGKLIADKMKDESDKKDRADAITKLKDEGKLPSGYHE